MIEKYRKFYIVKSGISWNQNSVSKDILFNFTKFFFCISASGICFNLHRLLLTMQCMVMDNSIQLQCNFNLLYSRLISDWSVFQISCLQIRHWCYSLKSSRSGGIWWWNSKILRKIFYRSGLIFYYVFDALFLSGFLKI